MPPNQLQAKASISRKRRVGESSTSQAPPTKRRVVISTPQTRRYTILTQMQGETMNVLGSIDKSLKSMAAEHKTMTNAVVNYLNTLLQDRNNE